LVSLINVVFFSAMPYNNKNISAVIKIFISDFVNTKIISWISKYQCKPASLTDGVSSKSFGQAKAFNYAASYNEFLSSIASSCDLDALKHLR
jgi:hypothetical protein